MTSTMAFAALGPLPFSVLYDASGSYSLAILVFLVLPVICATLALLAPRPTKAGALAASVRRSGRRNHVFDPIFSAGPAVVTRGPAAIFEAVTSQRVLPVLP